MAAEDKKDFSKIFESERGEWKEKIQVMSLHMKDIKTLAKAQVDLFSERQVLLEYSYKLAAIISKLNSKNRVERARKLKEYSEKSDIRYGANEKTVLIEGDLTEIAEKIELVEGHRKFIDQTIQTVDHMLYGVKSRIALEDYLRGSTIK
jgi:DNA repair exonuclease SbcCD ATPase subunit